MSTQTQAPPAPPRKAQEGDRYNRLLNQYEQLDKAERRADNIRAAATFVMLSIGSLATYLLGGYSTARVLLGILIIYTVVTVFSTAATYFNNRQRA